MGSGIDELQRDLNEAQLKKQHDESDVILEKTRARGIFSLSMNNFPGGTVNTTSGPGSDSNPATANEPSTNESRLDPSSDKKETDDRTEKEEQPSDGLSRSRSSFRRSHRLKGAMAGREEGGTQSAVSLRDSLLSFSKPADEKDFTRFGSPALPEIPTDFRSKTRASMSFMKSKSMMAASRPTFARLLTNSFEAANPEMGYIARNILAQIFMPWGIFWFIRLVPFLYFVSAPLVLFCPPPDIETTICGLAGSPGGLYDGFRIFAAIYIVFLLLMLLVVLWESADPWINYFDSLFYHPNTKEFSITISSLFDVSQQDNTPVNQKVFAAVKDPNFVPKKRLSNRVAYCLLAPLLLAYTLVRPLFQSPKRLSENRYYGDFEICICFQTGTINSLMGLVAGILAVVSNGGVSLFGYLLIISCISLFIFAYIFSNQFAADDERSHFSAFLTLHFMPSRTAPLVDSIDENEDSESPDPLVSARIDSNFPSKPPAPRKQEPVYDIPLYRTIRYRQRLDYRGEGQLKDFQVLQLINLFKKHCQVTELWFDANNGISTGAAAVFCSYLLSGSFEAIESVNYLNVKDLILENALTMSPDAIRSESVFAPANDAELVPWNPEISWRDGLWFGQRNEDDRRYSLTAKDSKLFPFLASVAMSMIDPFRLVEIDLGSNELTDESVFQISNLITKSQNLFLLELGGNKFGIENGFKPLVKAITNHETIKFVRLSTVLLNLAELRSSSSIDLSLPRIYASGIERVVQSVFEACLEVDSLKSDFFGTAKKASQRALENHYMIIRDMISRDYRYLGRDFYRTITPSMVKHVLERVAHRVGKYIVSDPGPRLDLSGERAVDGLYLNTERAVLEEKLYLSLLDECDILLVCAVIEKWNEGIEEIDFKGMPLVHDWSRHILEMLGDRKKIRTINFTGCGIRDPELPNHVLNLLRKDSPCLREIGMRGNPAMKGKTPAILRVIDEPDRKSHPNVIIDQPVLL